MTDNNHPITPPFELVRQWAEQMTTTNVGSTTLNLDGLATQAARWGADQQLDQDTKWLDTNALFSHNLTITPSGGALRQVMRPKPPSLREQALDELYISFDRGYLKISQKQIVCPKHGTHKHHISSDIEGHKGSWCMLCWLETLGPSLPLVEEQAND